MSHKTADPKMKACLDECLRCHHACLHMAMTHCLEEGGKHAEPAHLRLMRDCAEICQTAANFIISGSENHDVTCRACAEICRKCAESCAQISGMEDCAAACRSCAEACEAMAAGGAHGGHQH